MKCQFCGSEIGLEDLYCAHCGRPNTAASKHAQDMKKFSKDYNRTKNEVVDSVSNFAGITMRIIIIAALIIGIIIVAIVDSNSYKIVRNKRAKEALKNEKELTAQLDGYLDKGDFIAFSQTVEYWDIDNYRLDGHFMKYRPLVYVTNQYSQLVVEDFGKLMLGSGSYSKVSVSTMCDNFNYFYKYTSEEYLEDHYEKDSYDGAVVTRCNSQMREDLRTLMEGYLGFTEEEAFAFENGTEGVRTTMLEEAAKHVDQFR